MDKDVMLGMDMDGDGQGDGHGHRTGKVMVLVMAVGHLGSKFWSHVVPAMAMGHSVHVGRAHLQGAPSLPLPSPTAGGQFKREVTVDGQSHLLLIREEAGAPDAQV